MFKAIGHGAQCLPGMWWTLVVTGGCVTAGGGAACFNAGGMTLWSLMVPCSPILLRTGWFMTFDQLCVCCGLLKNKNSTCRWPIENSMW